MPSRTNELAYASCTTAEICNAYDEELTKDWIGPLEASINAHLGFMKSRPAARCFRDAYAADLSIARGYLAWLTDWEIGQGDLTSAGRFQIIALDDLNERADAFLSTDYYRDCG